MLSIKDQAKHWRDSAQNDLKTMKVLFGGKRYSDSLFYGHIVLEKILKAFVILETKKEPPKIHNLIRLVEPANLDLDDENLKYFATVNNFNIRARYDDYKNDFYKICTKGYVTENSVKIVKIYKLLCQKLKQKEL